MLYNIEYKIVRTLLTFLALFAINTAAIAEDAVVFIHPSTGRTAQATGTIEDYNYNELIIRTTNGQIKTIETDSIKEIKSERSAFFQEAVMQMNSLEFSKATQLLESALSQTSVSWKKQEVLAKQVECLCCLDRYEEAAMKYVNILQLDSNSAYWDSIPIIWTSVELSSRMEQTALKWIRQQEIPALSLLGASFLLTSSNKTAAQTALNALSKSNNVTISVLAQMQLNRLSLTQMSANAIKNLENKVDQTPKSVQFGARFILAQLWGRSVLDPAEKTDKIAVNYLQCALNSRTPVELQARSLYSAGSVLMNNNRQDEALRIFSYLVQKYPDSQWSQQARRTAGGKL